MKNIDIASTSSGLPRETYMISKRVMWLMRNYFWIVTWFYPKGGHGSTFMEANILKYGSKWNCQYNGVDQCVHRATVIQVGVSCPCINLMYELYLMKMLLLVDQSIAERRRFIQHFHRNDSS